MRLGERASIGVGTWTSAHGGAIESVLDEATAELAKMEWATMVSTIEVGSAPLGSSHSGLSRRLLMAAVDASRALNLSGLPSDAVRAGGRLLLI